MWVMHNSACIDHRTRLRRRVTLANDRTHSTRLTDLFQKIDICVYMYSSYLVLAHICCP